MSCQDHCPKSLPTTAAIAGLKRRTARALLAGEL
jgi:succinate dehydrogenase/fumarate reductase-like Fe-S protein